MAHPELKPLEGKYEILGKLAEGGMGAVYKVHHRLLDETRVIKVIRPQLGDNGESRQRFLREARSAVRLRHPNIALLHDFTVDADGTAYMVMEYIDGVNLVDLVRQNGRPSIGLVLEVGIQTLRALGYLHKNDFVHRDVSPDNIMLTRDVEENRLIKLIDLGIAKPIGSGQSLTSQGLFLGKVHYASPEQFGGTTGSATVEPRSDLYSLGIVLYVLLTGKYPIQGQDHAALMAGHLFHPPVSFEQSDPEGRIPDSLRRALMRSLAKEPTERFASAEDFSVSLAAIRTSLSSGDAGADAGRESPVTTVVTPMPAPPPTPGTTQEKLDHYFAGGPTTPPISDAVTPVSTPGPAAEPPRPALVVPPPPGAALSADGAQDALSSSVGAEAQAAISQPAVSQPAPTRAMALDTNATEPPLRRRKRWITKRRVLVALGVLIVLSVLGEKKDAKRPGDDPETAPVAGSSPLASAPGAPADDDGTGPGAGPMGSLDAASPASLTGQERATTRPHGSSNLEGEADSGRPGALSADAAGAGSPPPSRSKLEPERSSPPSLHDSGAGAGTRPEAGADRTPTAVGATPRTATRAGADARPDRDLETLEGRLRAGDADAEAEARALLESARAGLLAARTSAQTSSAARLAATEFESAKLAQRDAERRESIRDWVGAVRAFREGATLFTDAARAAEQARASGRTAAQQAASASGEERAILEAIEAYAQAQRRRSVSSLPDGPSYPTGSISPIEGQLASGSTDLRIEACTVRIAGTRATAECRVRSGGLSDRRALFRLEKSGSRWLVVGEDAV